MASSQMSGLDQFPPRWLGAGGNGQGSGLPVRGPGVRGRPGWGSHLRPDAQSPMVSPCPQGLPAAVRPNGRIKEDASCPLKQYFKPQRWENAFPANILKCFLLDKEANFTMPRLGGVRLGDSPSLVDREPTTGCRAVLGHF